MSRHTPDRHGGSPWRKLLSFWVVFPVLALACLAVFTFVLPIRLVATGSMTPTIPAGTLVMNMPVDHVQKGEIITFREEPTGDIVTHRVYAVDANGDIETKGDANPTPDVHSVPLRMHDVVGIVVGGRGIPLVTAVSGIVAVLLALVVLYAIQQYRSLRRAEHSEQRDHEPALVGADHRRDG